MSSRVLLHVGTPKTGTSYLQEVLFRNRPVLEEAGICYPAERFDAHFLAALDLMRLPWGGLESEAVGAWDRLAAQVREHDGTAVVSHEILARATRAQAARALESLGHRADGTGAEVHVVLSVRDLARQIPAEWQENVKHRRELRYATFLDEIRDPERESAIASWFWSVQEIPDILARWGADLPPEQVHLVTVPPREAPRDLLWQRFRRTFGLDGIELDLAADRTNPSLGVPETALLRRINRAVNAEIAPADYRPLVRELLAHQTLSQRTRSPRLALPPAHRDWVTALAETWVAELSERGYAVEGDLEELLPAPEPDPYVDPDRPPQRQVAGAAVDAIAALLRENARLRQSEERLAGELDETRRALERSYLRPTYRLREKVVGRLQRGRVGSALLDAYRRVRGRSSRSA